MQMLFILAVFDCQWETNSSNEIRTARMQEGEDIITQEKFPGSPLGRPDVQPVVFPARRGLE